MNRLRKLNLLKRGVIVNGNPYHDELGRFASGPGGAKSFAANNSFEHFDFNKMTYDFKGPLDISDSEKYSTIEDGKIVKLKNLKEYYQKEKDVEVKVYAMKPEEYSKTIVDNSTESWGYKNIDEVSLRTSEGGIDMYAEKFKNGEKVDVPYIIFDRDGTYSSQEGFHRTLAAKKVGDEIIPVVLKESYSGKKPKLNYGEDITEEVEKYFLKARKTENANPYHDELGRFASGPGGTSILKNGIFPDYEMKPKDGYTILYHNTSSENVDSIIKEGLKIGKNLEGYKKSPEEGNAIWTSTESPKSAGYGGNTIAFQITIEEAEKSKVNSTEHMISHNIDAKDILFVDRLLYDNHKVSELPRFVNKYGKDKTIEVLKRRTEYSEKEIVDLIDSIPKKMITNANPYHDKLGRFTTGPGGTKLSLDKIDSIIEKYHNSFRENQVFKEIAENLGYTKNPKVVSEEEFDKLKSSGEYDEFYRGFSNHAFSGYESENDIIDSLEYARDFIDGDYYEGSDQSRFGHGMYFSENPEFAAAYSSVLDDNPKHFRSTLITIVAPKDNNYLSVKDTGVPRDVDEFEAFMNFKKDGQERLAEKAKKALSNNTDNYETYDNLMDASYAFADLEVATYAMIKGYDGLYWDAEETGQQGKSEYVLFDRSKIILKNDDNLKEIKNRT